MAGHSKWANIQHRKGAQDKKRGKLFSKLIREITVASKLGGPDLSSNPRLRLAVDKQIQSMPKDNITIKGNHLMVDYQEIRYEDITRVCGLLTIKHISDSIWEFGCRWFCIVYV